MNHITIARLNKSSVKSYVHKKLAIYQRSKIYKAAETKSKVRDYVCHRPRTEMDKTPKYMNKLTRKQCSEIFKSRARMTKLKANYKAMYYNTECRWCKYPIESLNHILTSCHSFVDSRGNTNLETCFSNELAKNIEAAATLKLIHQKIEEHNNTQGP